MELLLTNRYSTGLFLSLSHRTLHPRVSYPLEKLIAWTLMLRKNSARRQAIRLNQQIIHEQVLAPAELRQVEYNVQRHAVHCILDLYRNSKNLAALDVLFPTTPEMRALIERSRQGRAGAVLVLPHLSNFDLALTAIARRGMRAQLISQANPGMFYKFQNSIRVSSGLEVTPANEESYAQAIERLQNGGVVITAVDRPLPGKRRTLNFFGQQAPLPAGHVRLALTAEVPVIVMSIKMRADGTYRFNVSTPIPMQSHADYVTTVRRNAENVLAVIESHIRQAPEQWLMFYPLWEGVKESRLDS